MRIGKKVLMIDGPCEVVSITDQGHYVLEPIKRNPTFLKLLKEKFNNKFKRRINVEIKKGQIIDIYI